MGLSPRVRGNQVDRAARQNGERSIPACAGEPSLSFLSVVLAEVYPRVCGGTRRRRMVRRRRRGLSPRVRGNRLYRLW